MPSDITPPRSTLVHGDSPTAQLALAAAFATKEAGGFAWAQGPSAGFGPEPRILRLVEQRAYGPRIRTFRADDFLAPPVDPASEEALLVTTSVPPGLQHRLDELLGLPRILQTLATRSVDRDGRAAIVFAGLEAFPRAYLEGTFLRKRTMESLRDLGISVYLTFRGPPPPALRAVCDLEWEIWETPELPWPYARVARRENGRPAPAGSGPTIVDVWAQERLDPSFMGWTGKDRGPARERQS